MRELEEFDLDGATARAWSRFQARLADHLADHLAETGDDVLVVEVQVAGEEVEGSTPYVRLARSGEGMQLRAEVSSNFSLAEAHRLDSAREASLVALGFHEPTVAAGEPEGEGSASFFADVPVGDADRLAVMTVRALREVFGVAHPAFLAAEGLEDDPEVPTPPHEPAVELDEPDSVMPDSAEHLRELVDRALTPLFGAPPEHDEDGDIPVPWGSSLVYVRVDDEAPVVELFSCVADGVTDLRRAAFEVNVLNRDARFIKFTLVADRVMARIHLPSWPFVPEHLRSMLTGMSAKIDDLDEDLVARVGGTRAIEEVPDDEQVPDDGLDDGVGLEAGPHRDASGRGDLDVALLTLLQLDAEAIGSVDPELAASVCGFDKALVVRMLGDTGRQEVAWRAARDRALAGGDTAEAEVCDHELHAWDRTTALLRQALRLIVERQLGRTTAGAQRAFPRAESTAPPVRVARKLFPPRSPRACVVEEHDDLAHYFGVAGLAELNEWLSEQSGCTVEVIDFGEQVAVVVDGVTGRLEYPFSIAAFEALQRELEETALDHVPTDLEEI